MPSFRPLSSRPDRWGSSLPQLLFLRLSSLPLSSQGLLLVLGLFTYILLGGLLPKPSLVVAFGLPLLPLLFGASFGGLRGAVVVSALLLPLHLFFLSLLPKAAAFAPSTSLGFFFPLSLCAVLLGLWRDTLLSWSPHPPRRPRPSEEFRRQKNRHSGGIPSSSKVEVLPAAPVPVEVGTLSAAVEPIRSSTPIKESPVSAEVETLPAAPLAFLSHEIRTPLQGILSASTLLEETPLRSDQAELLRLIRQSSHILLALFNDLLDISKLQAGKLQIEDIDFDLIQTIEDLVAGLAPLASQKGLTFSATSDPQIPSLLRGDPLRFSQILLNLLSNALKFTEEGEVAVIARLESIRPGEASIAIRVKDTGIGITPEATSHLFETFTQGESSTCRRFGGSGLGLRIARSLAEAMGGSLALDPPPAKGSSFCLRLSFPIAPKALLSPLPHPSIHKRRILIAEAHPRTAHALSERLTAWGGRCTLLSEKDEILPALLRAAHTSDISDAFDLLFLDLSLFFSPAARPSPAFSSASLSATPLPPTSEASRSVASFVSQILAQPRLSSLSIVLLLPFASPPVSLPRPFPTVYKPLRTEALSQALWQLAPPSLAPPLPAPSTPSLLSSLSHLQQALPAVFLSASSPPHLSVSSILPDPPPSQASVLVVEDNPLNQQILKILLASLDISASFVSSGWQALTVLDQGAAFQAILMDCQLPGLNGFQTTEMIRKTFPKGTLLILGMSASDRPEDQDAALKAGMDAYHPKPLDRAFLLRFLQAAGTAPPSPTPSPSA